MLMPRKSKDISMTGEKGIVVFDSATQKEQMAIDFSLTGSSSDTALVVPTPVKSDISQIKKAVFDDLWHIVKPVVESDTKSSINAMPTSSVKVLERKVVGSFEIAVLKSPALNASFACDFRVLIFPIFPGSKRINNVSKIPKNTFICSRSLY